MKKFLESFRMNKSLNRFMKYYLCFCRCDDYFYFVNLDESQYERFKDILNAEIIK